MGMDFLSAANYIQKNLNAKATIAVVLGSGLSKIADNILNSDNGQKISYKDIPGFPISTVDGHKGELIYGHIGQAPVIALSGRLHKYEGYQSTDVVFPLRTLKFLGINTVILTNMSGCMADGFEPGQLMALTDHINFTGDNPLIGPNISELGDRFVDMSESYDKGLTEMAIKIAQENQITIHKGVYAGVLGPTYETPAEIRMFKALGCSAVGMSTVFETIAARHMGMKVLGIACLSNYAAGLSLKKINHEEVFTMGARMSGNLFTILRQVIKSHLEN